jgi:hypothetical protein
MPSDLIRGWTPVRRQKHAPRKDSGRAGEMHETARPRAAGALGEGLVFRGAADGPGSRSIFACADRKVAECHSRAIN